MKRFLPVLLACGVAVSAFAQTQTFTLKSADIAPGAAIKLEQVASGNGCTGANVSPALEWAGAPAGTKSFALILHDPDAPTGVGGFTHWIVYNIPASSSSLAKGAGTAGNAALPAGTMQASNSGGAPAYGGPCPPIGDKPHQYVFTLYALKTEKLELPASTTQAIAGFTINANAIGKATFSGYYGR